MDRAAVAVAAGAAAWEAHALRTLATARPGLTVTKRCVDLPDLLATAATGQVHIALVDAELRGLDADSVAVLAQHGVGTVAVVGADPRQPERVGRLGVARTVRAPGLDGLAGELRAALPAAQTGAAGTSRPIAPPIQAAAAPAGAPADGLATRQAAQPPAGRVVAVWGPAGAPGRTTCAIAVGAVSADQGSEVLLVDADCYGGAVAQHLGMLEEVSGLLAAGRAANEGRLDGPLLRRLARQVGPRLAVLTGLPRPDRWPEARHSSTTTILQQARGVAGTVVVDTGFCLEGEAGPSAAGSAPQRNQLTLSALGQADVVVTVGTADPVGLTRLARGLVELRAVVPDRTVHVVVNRMRRGVRWPEREVRAMVADFVGTAEVHFLPDDQAACDRALMAGRTLVETGDSALRRAVVPLAHAVGSSPPTAGHRLSRRRRRAGTAR